MPKKPVAWRFRRKNRGNGAVGKVLLSAIADEVVTITVTALVLCAVLLELACSGEFVCD
ncbi:hypothetical protein KEJ15_02780 [Candidatus Bathyarchaeota archaeon]|nr:hypothetical protein [Candidatus Bathyarchaeota archaeon]